VFLLRLVKKSNTDHVARLKNLIHALGVLNPTGSRKDIPFVICIGENESSNTEEILKMQLEPCIEEIKMFNQLSFCIAYEPVYAIGTGRVPSTEHLKSIFNFLKTLLESNQIQARLLYGGSVDSSNIVALSKSNLIDGYLVGKASLEFQELEKMLTSLGTVY